MIHNAIQTHCKAFCSISAHHRVHRRPTAGESDVAREEPNSSSSRRPLVHPSLPRRPSRNVRVPTDGRHLPGATVRQTRARSLAEHATANTTEEANDRCRTPDDSTAKDEYSDHNRTTPAIRQAPEWAPFTFLGLSCQLRRTAHGRFVEARPARPTSTRLRPRHARDAPSGGSIVAQTKTHTGPRGYIARKDWRKHGTRDEMRGTRGQPGPRRVDDGDRDAGMLVGVYKTPTPSVWYSSVAYGRIITNEADSTRELHPL